MLSKAAHPTALWRKESYRVHLEEMADKSKGQVDSAVTRMQATTDIFRNAPQIPAFPGKEECSACMHDMREFTTCLSEIAAELRARRPATAGILLNLGEAISKIFNRMLLVVANAADYRNTMFEAVRQFEARHADAEGRFQTELARLRNRMADILDAKKSQIAGLYARLREAEQENRTLHSVLSDGDHRGGRTSPSKSDLASRLDRLNQLEKEISAQHRLHLTAQVGLSAAAAMADLRKKSEEQAGAFKEALLKQLATPRGEASPRPVSRSSPVPTPERSDAAAVDSAPPSLPLPPPVHVADSASQTETALEDVVADGRAQARTLLRAVDALMGKRARRSVSTASLMSDSEASISMLLRSSAAFTPPPAREWAWRVPLRLRDFFAALPASALGLNPKPRQWTRQAIGGVYAALATEGRVEESSCPDSLITYFLDKHGEWADAAVNLYLLILSVHEFARRDPYVMLFARLVGALHHPHWSPVPEDERRAIAEVYRAAMATEPEQVAGGPYVLKGTAFAAVAHLILLVRARFSYIESGELLQQLEAPLRSKVVVFDTAQHVLRVRSRQGDAADEVEAEVVDLAVDIALRAAERDRPHPEEVPVVDVCDFVLIVAAFLEQRRQASISQLVAEHGRVVGQGHGLSTLASFSRLARAVWPSCPSKKVARIYRDALLSSYGTGNTISAVSFAAACLKHGFTEQRARRRAPPAKPWSTIAAAKAVKAAAAAAAAAAAKGPRPDAPP